MADALESAQEGIDRIEAKHPGFKVYTAGGRWFARRHGPLTDQERRTRPQSPLEAAGPDELAELLAAQDEPAEAGDLDAWTT